MDAYAPEIERKMKRLFDSLSEDDRRRYAAVEATKLGHGGIEYIAQLLQCDPKTIRRGLGACPGISIQVTSMDDQSVQVASIRPQCLFAPIPAA